MKKNIFKLIAGLVLCSFLFSFSPVGGEGFTVHLNNKLLVEHYFTAKSVTPVLTLDRASVNGELAIYYNECGQIGKHRSLTIKDEKGLVLKEWSYTDATKEHTPMYAKVKDILALKHKSSGALKLFYFSQRVSDGRLLATITIADEVKAKK